MPHNSPRWTNASISKLPQGVDPVQFAIGRAREITLEAIENGWSGPPYDPLELARYLGIAVEPREGISEARTVPAGKKGFRIEFNPNRPRGRLRYSIAHEIAHTFFPDCEEKIRHRLDREEMTGDEWQLEMLCNIAAAELLMPIGTLPDLRTQIVSIEALMRLRRKFDVSIEALLLRFIRLTTQPCALFSASRADEDQEAIRYRVDYAVASSSWAGNIPLGMMLPESSVVGECTAIGFTGKAEERWQPNHMVHVECVGAPPYPNRLYPRVLGFITDPDNAPPAVRAITYVQGDATKPMGKDPRIISHIVNDRSATWGAGFSRQLARLYPDAQIDFRAWTRNSEDFHLGGVRLFGAPKFLQIASMVAQEGFGPSNQPRIRYPALETCLGILADHAATHNGTVHMPRIGCGIAGGKWDVVEELVENLLVQRGIQVLVYDLPPRRR